MIKFIEDTVGNKQLIEATIKDFGYAPEHNYFWYQYSAARDEKNIFAMDDTGAGLFTMMSNKDASIFSSPIAPSERRAGIIIEYINEVFQMPGIKKVHLELETPLRKEVLKLLPDHCEPKRINYSLTWPIMNMRTFDATLPGGHYKSIRKERNRFYREHAVEVRNAKDFGDRESLRAMVLAWKKNRTPRDYAWCDEYINIIEGNFEGTETARIFMVDGKPAGMNAGWMIPHSDRFYGAIGLHDYSSPELGNMLYLEDLEYLKAHGYGEVDMAGSWHGLLDFKKKFLPESYYKTHVFSVAKK